VIANQRKADDTLRWVSAPFRRTCQFEDIRENFDGDPIDSGLGVLLAGEDGLYAGEECY
jgi:hypothetical protein